LWADSRPTTFLEPEGPARSVDALHEAIGTAMSTVTPSDCVAFFRNCGYPATSKGAPL